ncbi:FecCD family ABC transporter permease [Pseudochrobactrum kiredjianiae]|uniref:FecCD family ABC transporter permease n=1 Tax=Pseudochrobactrum kiredjianiae TaxID=386305 RepID=A0ABW3V0F3_9HYPH|nr:iron ABC transporter permease [Pseudochrobactrum kiredjianiae]MDM7852601.1 iron ABC transporter permease [Pseudochrobactrum kiredjianiae]
MVRRFTIVLSGMFLLLAGLLLSVSYGAADISYSTIVKAVFAFDGLDNDHLILREFRIPSALAAALVGAALGAAGALMQGITRNPLASPSLMGLNAGAGLMLVLGLALSPTLAFTVLIGLSFAGAAMGVAVVFLVGSAQRGGLTPVRLTLAGAAVSVFFGAFTSFIIVYYKIGQDVLFYTAGGVQGVQEEQLLFVAPWIGGGLIVALLLSRSVSLLSLGQDVATGLGLNIVHVRILAGLAILILAGSSVALAGGIGFVGLVVPHVSRFLTGLDYRWIVPVSAILGACLLVFADLAARMINPPYEIPVGLMTALIGVPFFLMLAWRDERGI